MDEKFKFQNMHKENNVESNSGKTEIGSVVVDSVKGHSPKNVKRLGEGSAPGGKRLQKIYSCDKCGKNFYLKNSLKSHLLSNCSFKRNLDIFELASKTIPSDNVGLIEVKSPKRSCSVLVISKDMPVKSDLKDVSNNTKCVQQTNRGAGKSSLVWSKARKRKSVCHNNGPFSCNLCTKKYTNRKSYLAHLRIHKTKGKFKCLICNKEYTCGDSLKRHLINHELRKQFQCTICNRDFPCQKSLDKHVLHHTSGTLLCLVCEENYPTHVKLNQHLKTHSESGSKFCCSECNQLFITHEEILKHLQTDHSFPDTKIKVTMEHSEHPCQLCDEIFQSKKALTEHVKTHRKYLTCPKCDKCFENEKKFDRHLFSHPKSQCTICKKVVLAVNLKRHIQLHSGDRPHQCSVCGKRFIQKTQLLRHEIVHMDKETKRKALDNFYKKHKMIKLCDICGKSYKSTNLKIHMKAHSQSNLSCQICSGIFYFRRNLYRHYLKHSKEEINTLDPEVQDDLRKYADDTTKPHKCSCCGKSFRSIHHLDTHMRIHTGERPFSCNKCDKAFNQKPHLVFHMSLHHSSEKHSCHLCGKTFATQTYLYNHLKTHSHLESLAKKMFLCSHCSKDFATQRSLLRHQKTCMSYQKTCVSSIEDKTCVSSIEDKTCVSSIEDKTCVSFIEDKTCVSSIEDKTCVSFIEDKTCVSSIEDKTCVSFIEDKTCVSSIEDKTCVSSIVDITDEQSLLGMDGDSEHWVEIAMHTIEERC